MTKHENNKAIKYYKKLRRTKAGLKTMSPVHLCGHTKKGICMLCVEVSFMYNPEAPFGLELFDLEALDRLTAERLMAERKRKGYLLSSNTKITQSLHKKLFFSNRFTRGLKGL